MPLPLEAGDGEVRGTSKERGGGRSELEECEIEGQSEHEASKSNCTYTLLQPQISCLTSMPTWPSGFLRHPACSLNGKITRSIRVVGKVLFFWRQSSGLESLCCSPQAKLQLSEKVRALSILARSSSTAPTAATCPSAVLDDCSFHRRCLLTDQSLYFHGRDPRVSSSRRRKHSR